MSELLAAIDGGELAAGVASHVAGCASCRRLVERARPAAHAEERGRGDADLHELPIVDPALYVRIEQQPEIRGGMGRTFVARDRRLGREVAIKQPLGRGEVPDSTLRETLRVRFEREARLTARLEHPAIVGVHEAGRFPDGEAFYAMRLVQGRSLADEIARLPSLAERLGLLPSLTIVAEALAYAHSRGVTHRDVKPGNILLGGFGETVLIDWGLAADAASTREGSLESDVYRRAELPLTDYGVGTPGYMAPEQARGSAPEAAADVYGLGATLYHVIAGRAPAPGFARPLAELVPEAPAPLVALVGRAMAEQPSERFESAAALAAELRRFHTGQLMASHRYSPRELLRHYLRRFRAPLAIAAIAAVVLIAVSAFYVRGLARSREHTERARRAAEASDRAAHAALRRQLGVTASQLADQPARRLEALTDGVRAVAPDLLAGTPVATEAWRGLVDALVAGPVAAPLVGHHGAVNAAAFVPGGSEVLTAGPDHTVRRWAVPSGRPLGPLTSRIDRPTYIRVSPDGAHAVVCGYDALAELQPLPAGPAIAIPLLLGDARCEFAADGTGLIAAGAEVQRLDPATGAVRARIDLPAAATALSIAPTGLVAAGTVGGDLVVWRPGTVPQVIAGAHPGGLRGIELVDGGARVLSGGSDGRTVARPVVGDRAGEPIALFEVPGQLGLEIEPLPGDDRVAALYTTNFTDLHGHSTFVLGGARPVRIPDFFTTPQTRAGWNGPMAGTAPDGARVVDPDNGRDLLRLPAAADKIHGTVHHGDSLLVVSIDGSTLMWDLRSGVDSGQLLGHTGEITALVSTGGELWSAALDGTLRRWSMTGAGGSPTTIDDGSEITAVAASPDGTRLATVGVDGNVRVHHTGDARAPVVLRGGAEALAFAAFSSDGARVLTATTAGRAQLWDADTGQVSAAVQLAGGAGDLSAGAFTADGSALVLGGTDGSLVMVDAARGAPIAALSTVDAGGGPDVTDPVDSLRVTPDGAALVVGFASARALVVDPRTLAVRARLEGRPAALLADGRIVAAALDGRVLIYPRSGGAPRILDGHTRAVLASAVTADGTHLATADQSGMVRVWDLDRGTAVLAFAPAAIGLPTALAFVDSGRALAVGGSIGGLRVVPVVPDLAVERGCALLAYFGRAGDVAGLCR